MNINQFLGAFFAVVWMTSCTNSKDKVGVPVAFGRSSVTINSMTEGGFIVPPKSIIVQVMHSEASSCVVEIKPHAFEGFKIVINLTPESHAQVNATHFTDVGPPFETECGILRGRITLSHDPFENPQLPVSGTYYLGVAYPPAAEPNNDTKEYPIYGSFVETK